MRNSLVLMSIIALLPACEMSRGGAGQTTGGQPVIAELTLDPMTSSSSIVLSSVLGWRCVGMLTKEQVNSTTQSTHTVPLLCDDGTTGTSILAIDPNLGKANINFRLADGTIGNAVVG